MATPTPPGQAAVPKPGDLQTTINGLISTALAGNGGVSPTMGSSQLSDTSQIYLGATNQQAGDKGHGISVPNMSTYAEARLLPTTWTDAQLRQFVTTGILRKIPGFQAGMGMPEIVSAWDDLVKTSFAFNNNGTGTKWTPQDIMDTYSNTKGKYGTVKVGDWMVDAATGEKVKYVGPKTKTSTSTSVDLSSAEDVKALTTSVLTQALGRAPTAAEVAQYKSTINAQEQANPTQSTQTQTLNDMGEVSNTSTTTSGGFDSAAQQQLVMDQAQKGPEYGKYQSGTTYWQAMMQMLGSGG